VKEVCFGDFPDTEIAKSREAIGSLKQFCVKGDVGLVCTDGVNDARQDHLQVRWFSSAFRSVPKMLAYETRAFEAARDLAECRET